VEICYNGVWGTVCDNGWDEVDARVVCQQLGFSYQRALPTYNSRFGDGEGPILFENVACNQDHSNLSQCVDFQYIGTFRPCIMHIAGVICYGMMMSTSTKQVPTGDLVTVTSAHPTTVRRIWHLYNIRSSHSNLISSHHCRIWHRYNIRSSPSNLNSSHHNQHIT
jgi:hypothetical protein